MKKEDLTGRKFGTLEVIGPAENIGRRTAWMCRCECGKVKPVTADKLKAGTTVSCGCKKNKTHGKRRTRLYCIWKNMKQRCGNPNNTAYKDYGGRGISVCREWAEDFGAFYDWAMANGYDDDLQIDRIDNDAGYSPENCRWITQAGNLANTRRNILVEIRGEKHTIAEWARISGVNERTLHHRLRAGKRPEEAIIKK